MSVQLLVSLSEETSEARRKLIVFTGAFQENVERLAGMIASTLGLRRLDPDITIRELEGWLQDDQHMYLVASQPVANKLRMVCGEQVCRVLIRPGRDNHQAGWELSFQLHDDEAYLLFAIANELDPLLDRGLAVYD